MQADNNKKILIWDLDNTLYPETEEFKDMLDEAAAVAAVEDLGVPLDLATAKAKVTQSYRTYRDGGEIFVREYGINPKDMFVAYHKRKPINPIVPYENLLEKLEKLPYQQFIFTTSSREVCIKILKHIGLYEFFKDRFYSVEDFGVYKKNESCRVYEQLCERIGVAAEDCIFIDDSYSNLQFAKEAGMTTVRIYYKENSARGMPFIDYACKGVYNFLENIMPGETAAVAAG